MLSNLNNIQFVLAHLRRCKDNFHQEAPLHEQKTFCFFLNPKEASDLSYWLQMKKRSDGDDYNVVKEEFFNE